MRLNQFWIRILVTAILAVLLSHNLSAEPEAEAGPKKKGLLKSSSKSSTKSSPKSSNKVLKSSKGSGKGKSKKGLINIDAKLLAEEPSELIAEQDDPTDKNYTLNLPGGSADQQLDWFEVPDGEDNDDGTKPMPKKSEDHPADKTLTAGGGIQPLALLPNPLEIGKSSIEALSGQAPNWQQFDLAALEVFPLGDPELMMPDTLAKVKNYCQRMERNLVTMKTHAMSRFIEDIPLLFLTLFMEVIAEYWVSSVREKNAEFCANEESMQEFADDNKLINKHNKALWRHRKDFINLMHSGFMKGKIFELQYMCCGYYMFQDRVEEVVPQKVQGWLSDYIYAYHTPLMEFWCHVIQKASITCRSYTENAYPSWRQQKPKFRSTVFGYLEVFTHDWSLTKQIMTVLSFIFGRSAFSSIGSPSDSNADSGVGNEAVDNWYNPPDPDGHGNEVEADPEGKGINFDDIKNRGKGGGGGNGGGDGEDDGGGGRGRGKGRGKGKGGGRKRPFDDDRGGSGKGSGNGDGEDDGGGGGDGGDKEPSEQSDEEPGGGRGNRKGGRGKGGPWDDDDEGGGGRGNKGGGGRRGKGSDDDNGDEDDDGGGGKGRGKGKGKGRGRGKNKRGGSYDEQGDDQDDGDRPSSSREEGHWRKRNREEENEGAEFKSRKGGRRKKERQEEEDLRESKRDRKRRREREGDELRGSKKGGRRGGRRRELDDEYERDRDKRKRRKKYEREYERDPDTVDAKYWKNKKKSNDEKGSYRRD